MIALPLPLRLILGSTYLYPAPSTISYLWNFGFYSLAILVSQVITGTLLLMYYTPDTSLAFSSVEYIMRDINYGWLIRYSHANGASFFFLAVYVHIFRGIYYGSFSHPRELLWLSGVIILLLMIVIAFMGYVLPWGQMSFWAATVITNLPASVPYIGPSILTWLWGGFTVDNPTLGHFFALHIVLSFFLIFLVIVHLSLLHEYGSNNPTGFDSTFDLTALYPTFAIKDLFGIIIFFSAMLYLVFFDPNLLGHPDNYIPANPMVTPSHIVPEWYFLLFYAILRCIPDKLMGFLALLLSVLLLSYFPFSGTPSFRGFTFKPLSKVFFWCFLFSSLALGLLGGKPIKDGYYVASQIFSIFYFFYILEIYGAVSHFDSLMLS